MSYGFVGVFVCCKGVAGKEVDSFSGKAVAQHIVKEEVVKFIGAYEVFCLLSDVAVAVGWNKFGADGCVYDVEQASADFGFFRGFRCKIVDKVFDRVLGTPAFTPYIDMWSPL